MVCFFYFDFSNLQGGSHSQQKKKLLFLGLDNAGKTTILHALIGANPYTVTPTRGFGTRIVEIDSIEFNIYDIGGQKSLRSHWEDYFDSASGIVWVIDSADKRRMYETGLELANLLQHEKIRNVPILILANKQDLATSLDADEVSFYFFSNSQITIELDLTAIRTRDWHIQACSAIEKTGIDEGFKWMAQAIGK